MKHTIEYLTIDDLKGIINSEFQPQHVKDTAAAELRQYRYQEQEGIADVMSQ